MKAWNDYALISEGVVQTVGCYAVGAYAEANMVAKELYGPEAFAVDVTQIPCQVGDTYENGVFRRDGHEVLPIPSDEEQISAHTEQIMHQEDVLKDHNSSIDNLWVALLEG